MKIYIDESGSFVGAPVAIANREQKKDVWNVIAALTVPDISSPKFEELITSLRQKFSNTDEIKFENIRKDEATYCNFLSDLKKLGVFAFYVVYNDSINSREVIEQDKQEFLAGMQDRIDLIEKEYKTICDQDVANEIAPDIAKKLIGENRKIFGEWNRSKQYMRELSIPLFVQMRMQVSLIARLLDRAINEYAFEYPTCLSEFDWVFDAKGSMRYEKSYLLCAKNLIQYEGYLDPFRRLPGANYKTIDENFDVQDSLVVNLKNKQPSFSPIHKVWDLERILGEKIAFVDSRSSNGVQAADMVVSGVAYCLRNKFKFNDSCASALGRLSLKDLTGYIDCIQFVNFGEKLVVEDLDLYKTVMRFEKNAKVVVGR